MDDLADTLSDLIEICRDGRHFYTCVAERIPSGPVRRTLLEMARVRQALVEAFSELMQAQGQTPPTHGTLRGRMFKLYAHLRAALSGDAETIYVAELEEAEDRLLQAFEDAMLTMSDRERAILRRYLPAAREAHECMRQMKARAAD